MELAIIGEFRALPGRERELEDVIRKVVPQTRSEATCLAISADGSKTVSGGADKTLKIWALPTAAPAPPDAKPSASFTLPAAVQSVAISSNGTLFPFTKTRSIMRKSGGGLNRLRRVFQRDCIRIDRLLQI